MHLIQLYNFKVFFFKRLYNVQLSNSRKIPLHLLLSLTFSLSLSRACVHIYPSSYLFDICKACNALQKHITQC